MSCSDALPVREAACHVYVQLVRKLSPFSKQTELIKSTAEEMYATKTFQMRLLFLSFADRVMEYYSRKFCKDHMFEIPLKLASDKVPSVRRRLCQLLPKLKKVALAAADAKYTQLHKECMFYLLNDKDKEIMECAHTVRKNFICNKIFYRQAN